jgi:uncharacterized protein (DUF58 family)
VTNNGRGVEELSLEEDVRFPLRLIEGVTKKVVRLPGDGEVEFEYRVETRRGRVDFQELRAVAREPFGLFYTPVSLAAPAQLLIRPQVIKLRRVEIRPQQTRGFTGPIAARLGGSGMDFFGVREYQMSDSLRRVNWRASARQSGDLFTNEFEQERIADIGLILDARQQRDIHGAKGSSLFEFSISATASLAEAFLLEGHRVSLLIYGHHLERVYPGFGKLQRERILRALARAETGFNYALESLNALPTRLFPAGSQLMIVAPVSLEDLPALIRLRALGYAVSILSPDPVDFETRLYGRESGRDTGMEASGRLAKIERRLLLSELARAGIPVVDWQVGQMTLNQAIQTSLARRSSFRRPVRNVL